MSRYDIFQNGFGEYVISERYAKVLEAGVFDKTPLSNGIVTRIVKFTSDRDEAIKELNGLRELEAKEQYLLQEK